MTGPVPEAEADLDQMQHNMQAARGHFDDSARALSSGRRRIADEIERFSQHSAGLAGQVSGAARIDALEDQCAGLEAEVKRLRLLLSEAVCAGEDD